MTQGELPEQVAAVVAWLAENGVVVPPNLDVRAGVEGFGLYTTTKIAPDSTIVEIPFTVALTIAHARASPIGRALAQLGAPSKTIMRCWLITERLTPGTKFGPYLRAMPETFSDPTWWSETDLDLLIGTNVYAAVLERYAP